MEYDFKKDIKIEEDRLDAEWIQHSSLFCKWLEYEVLCSDLLEKKEEELDLCIASTDMFIRTNSGDKKITEAGIKNEIIASEEVQRIKKEVLDARYNLGIAKAAVKAFEHRKKALERLCDLWMFGYNSAPKQNIKENILNNIQKDIRSKL